MNFNLNEEQQMCQDAAKEFAERFITEEMSAKCDGQGFVDEELFQAMCEAGFTGLIFDEKYGGAGLGVDCFALTLEQLAKADPNVSSVLVLAIMFLFAINLYGTEEQKQYYLTNGIAGKFHGSFAFTEPSTGSDPVQLKTVWEKKDGKYVINGVKRFISGADYKGPIIIFANEKGNPNLNTTAFIIEKHCKGYSLSTPWEKVAGHANSVYDIFLDDVECPLENTLGGEGGAFKILKGVIAFSKTNVMAQCVGNMGHAYELAVKYAKEKLHRDVPIAKKYQATQLKIAEIAAIHQSCQLLVYRLATHLTDATPETMPAIVAEAGMVKGYVSVQSVDCVMKAVTVMGAYGICDEYKVAHCMLEALQYPVVEGNVEIQNIMFAKYALRD